jgi:hypothetical protein
VFKRIMLPLTFAATLSAASLWLADNADARRWVVRSRPYAAYYAPRTYAYAPYRVYYSQPVYGGYYAPGPYAYGYPGYNYYRPGLRVGVGVGPWGW